MYSNTTGTNNVAVGRAALDANTTASKNTALGDSAAGVNTTGASLTAVGADALLLNTTGSYNTAVGDSALISNTTATRNVALGYQAGYTNTTGYAGVFVGYRAGYNSTGNLACFVGDNAGQNSTGTSNTLIGQQAGYLITSGTNNTVIGRYDGNQGGIDIRTSSNNIVLSDGDGNPRLRISPGGDLLFPGTDTPNNAQSNFFSQSNWAMSVARPSASSAGHIRFENGSTLVGTITSNTSSVQYNTTSDHRLKENVVDMTGATTRLKQLNPVRFNFIADADTTVDGFLAHEVQTVVPEAVTGTHNEADDDGNPVYQGLDQSKLVPLLVATIQELEARIATLEAK
jgi:hypothetical protein